MYFALCCTHSVVQATVWQALSACSTKVAGPHAYCKAREAYRHTSTSELYEGVAACASRLPLCTAGHVRMPGVEPGSQAWEACMMRYTTCASCISPSCSAIPNGAQPESPCTSGGSGSHEK